MFCVRVVFTCIAAAAAQLSSALAMAAQPTPEAANRATLHSIAPSAADGSEGTALLGAFVGADATLQKSAGATSVTAVGTGLYQVDFNRDVINCFYSVTPFYAGYDLIAEPRTGDFKGVYVSAHSRDGTAANIPFYLTVFCSK